MPKTALMITSSVTDCMTGSSWNGRPTGSASIARSVASCITVAYSRIRSPWNDGSISLRWRRCSAPSSSNTDRSPSTGPRGAFASPARSRSGGARKTCLTVSGS